jgi:hypothetical protein
MCQHQAGVPEDTAKLAAFKQTRWREAPEGVSAQMPMKASPTF